MLPIWFGAWLHVWGLRGFSPSCLSNRKIPCKCNLPAISHLCGGAAHKRHWWHTVRKALQFTLWFSHQISPLRMSSGQNTFSNNSWHLLHQGMIWRAWKVLVLHILAALPSLPSTAFSSHNEQWQEHWMAGAQSIPWHTTRQTSNTEPEGQPTYLALQGTIITATATPTLLRFAISIFLLASFQFPHSFTKASVQLRLTERPGQQNQKHSWKRANTSKGGRNYPPAEPGICFGDNILAGISPETALLELHAERSTGNCFLHAYPCLTSRLQYVLCRHEPDTSNIWSKTH